MTTILDLVREWRRPRFVAELRLTILAIEERAYGHALRIDPTTGERTLNIDEYRRTRDSLLDAMVRSLASPDRAEAIMASAL